MAISLKHAFTSNVADSGDTTLVQPSNWNAEHSLTMAADRLLGRTTANTGSAEEISVGTGLTLSSGSLSVTANTYQPLDSDLTAIAALSPALDNFIVGNGTSWITESGATARSSLGLGTLATQNGTFSGTSSGTNTGDQNIFQTIAVSGQSNVVADSTADTLTLVAGANITITTNATTDAITIAAAAEFPSGTRMIFQQTAAPTGWTKETSSTFTNAALRIVSGTVGTGGTIGWGTVFSSTRTVSVSVSNTTDTGTVGNTTLTTAQMPTHTHTYSGGLQSNTTATGAADRINNLTGTTAPSGTTTSNGSSNSHTHSLTMNSHTHTASGTVDLDVKYVEFIIATKD